MITVTLTADQLGKSTIALSPAQLLSIDAQRAAPQPTPPGPGPTPPSGAITYPVAALMPRNTEPAPWDSDPTRADRMFLWRMQQPYSNALKAIRGAHQLFEDMLTDARGHTVRQLEPNLIPTAGSVALQNLINACKNDVGSTYAAATGAFNVATYAGPLRAVYDALVAAKQAGK